MKKISLSFFIFSSVLLFSQNVAFKKDKVIVDKKELLNYQKGGTFGAITYDLSEINPKKDIIVLVDDNAGTHPDISDDFVQIKFITIGTKAEIRGSIKDAIKLLLKNQVLTDSGKFDESKVELFIKNYDEKISERTIITR